jgi:ketosteroid isomerase-like protein
MSPAIVCTLDEARVAGEWAFVRGKNTGVMRPRSGGEARALNDVFVMILQRQGDGQWKIARLIWHRASP